MSRLIIINGVQEGRAYRLRPGLNRIGRNLENHFQIPDGSVSSNHCEIIVSDAGFLVRDLNSTNGTSIAGAPITEGLLDLGQIIQVGTIELRLEEMPQTDAGPSVSIPELPKEHATMATTLQDGSPACSNHPEAHALYRCTQCQQTLCPSCVRTVRRLKGETFVFCSLCSGSCETLVIEPTGPNRRSWAKVLLGSLTQTLKLPFKR
jgi:hypothetical protein